MDSEVNGMERFESHRRDETSDWVREGVICTPLFTQWTWTEKRLLLNRRRGQRTRVDDENSLMLHTMPMRRGGGKCFPEARMVMMMGGRVKSNTGEIKWMLESRREEDGCNENRENEKIEKRMEGTENLVVLDLGKGERERVKSLCSRGNEQI